MKIKICSIFTGLLITACSSYSVKTEIENTPVLSKLKSSGIIFRLNKKSVINYDKNSSNFLTSVASYKYSNKIKLINDAAEGIKYYGSLYNRFYQYSIERSFLKFKSMGVIKTFVRKNELDLKRIMKEKNLDSLIFYEIDGGSSDIMQIFDFNSVIVIVDSNLKIAYLDYQSDKFQIDEMDSKKLEKHMLDGISSRFISLLSDLGFIYTDE